jgi:hypothetical protein
MISSIATSRVSNFCRGFVFQILNSFKKLIDKKGKSHVFAAAVLFFIHLTIIVLALALLA